MAAEPNTDQLAPHVTHLDPWGLDDLGNADRFCADHSELAKHVDSMGAWFIWAGTHWMRGDTREEERLARETIGKMSRGIRDIPNEDTRKHAIKWLRKSRAASGVRGMISLARSDRRIARRAGDFDTDPWFLNLGNNTIDLGRLARGEAGGILEHNPAHMITKLARVSLNMSAKAPLWERTLFEVFDGNIELMDFFQRCAGYSATGLVHEQKCFFCHGEGANGKSVVLGAIMHVLGDYAGLVNRDILIDGTRHPTELTNLQGRRMVLAAEPDQNQRISESRLKAIVGIDPIMARGMNENFYSFNPTHKLWLATNVLPKIKSQDHGTWRRPLVIPFAVTFPDHKQDKDLPAKLLGESSGILNWLIEGVVMYGERGLAPPLCVVNASSEYKRDQDMLGFFVADKLEVVETGSIRAERCYSLYQDWCTENKIADRFRMSGVSFGKAMKARKGVHDVRLSDGIEYRGVREK